ncbi:MAG: CCA tRNA nucleotidyltransferase [Traorella sp.]
MKSIKEIVPQPIQEIMMTLSQNYEVYLVGGCVRDYILEHEIHDFDCTTNASVDEMKETLSSYKMIETGLKHGTLTIINQGFFVEITTYRIDKDYQNHRSPSQIEFTKNIHEDLKRRDFTINALACDLNGNIIDDHHGLIDIKNKIIACVGDPISRFNEDALRILRAIRFSCTLGFKIDIQSEEAIFKSLSLLEYISIERKRDELFKILVSKKDIYTILEHYQLFSIMKIPYFDTIQNIDSSKLDLEIRLACLFDSVESARQTLSSWNCSNKLIKKVMKLIQSRQLDFHDNSILRESIYTNGICFTRKILSYNHLDSYSFDKIIIEHDYIEKLAITGFDLYQLGYRNKEIQLALNQCFKIVFQDPSMNQKEILLEKMRLV